MVNLICEKLSLDLPNSSRGIIALSFKEPDQYNRRQTLRAPLVDDGTVRFSASTRAQRSAAPSQFKNASQEKS
jgi:hypothetical protein